MNDIARLDVQLPAMTQEDINIATSIENIMLGKEQFELETHHTIHGGVYSRTIILKAGQAITGATIKVPTTLIINGNMKVYIGAEVKHVIGVAILTASANRKQVMVALEDTSVTMLFQTKATTIEEAEEEFTNDSDRLASRLEDAINIINISGE